MVFLAFLFYFLGETPVIAGDGSGGGKNNPLALVSSSPADGQQNVNTVTEIKLSFSKNVVYMTVREQNQKCFTLCSQQGEQIPTQVIMADDQIEPEKRREVILKPLQELEPGTTYVVKVAPQLESKSGVSLGNEVTVTFTTAGAKPAVAEPAEQISDADRQDVQAVAGGEAAVIADELSPQQEANADSASLEKPLTESFAKEESKQELNSLASRPHPDTDKNNLATIAALIVAVIAILSYAVYKKNKRS